MQKFNMNEKVRDIITGFTGIVTGYAKYFEDEHFLYRVEKASVSGLVIEWIQENRLESLDDE